MSQAALSFTSIKWLRKSWTAYYEQKIKPQESVVILTKKKDPKSGSVSVLIQELTENKNESI